MVIAALAFGAAALLLGAHVILVAGFFLIGAGALYLLFRNLEVEHHPPVEPVDTATPAARIESMADRMWELHKGRSTFSASSTRSAILSSTATETAGSSTPTGSSPILSVGRRLN